MRALAALALALAAAPGTAAVPVSAARVVARFPHDPGAFTEGLFWLGGALYESTGPYAAPGTPGPSTIRKVDPASGRVMRSTVVAQTAFGEGIAPWKGEIVSLTWREGRGWRWRLADFARLAEWRYPGEGWALTGDGRSLIMSDGTSTLRFLDPATLAERRRLAVTADGAPVEKLNELEYVDGEILANVWQTDRIARIDPGTGHVVGWIDVAALHAAAGASDPDAVANGIAWDPARRRLFVTGKFWPTMFEIAPPKKRTRS